VKTVFSTYGLDNLWTDPNQVYNLDGKLNNGAQNISQHRNFWKRFITKVIMDYEEKNWLTLINDFNKYPKLRTYCLFKKKLKLEPYLLTQENYLGRKILTSLRSGTNALMIERGRWLGLDEKERFCLQCDSRIPETEKHFLITCTRYSNYRSELFNQILNVSGGKWNLFNRTVDDRFLLLINGTQDSLQIKIFKLVQRYLIKCFKIRTDFIEDEV